MYECLCFHDICMYVCGSMSGIYTCVCVWRLGKCVITTCVSVCDSSLFEVTLHLSSADLAGADCRLHQATPHHRRLAARTPHACTRCDPAPDHGDVPEDGPAAGQRVPGEQRSPTGGPCLVQSASHKSCPVRYWSQEDRLF